jgi:DNA-binding transcriptional LysR family regulator
MITLKQLEALHWIATLGTFERAATKMNTTQSAVSKRMQELEAVSGITIFDRSRRGAKLTEKGENLLTIGREMLRLQSSISDLAELDAAPIRTLRLGVTELSTLTWFPRLVAALGERFPSLSIQPDVDTSRDLYGRLNNDELDLIIIPESFVDPGLKSVRMVQLTHCWVAKPGLVTEPRPLSAEQLASYPVISQGRSSGTGMLFNRWIRDEGLSIPRHISCDNLMAVLGLTVAGMGIGSAPFDCCRQLVEEGTLELIDAALEVPPVNYAAMFKTNRPTALVSSVVEIAQEVCDFSLRLKL